MGQVLVDLQAQVAVNVARTDEVVARLNELHDGGDEPALMVLTANLAAADKKIATALDVASGPGDPFPGDPNDPKAEARTRAWRDGTGRGERLSQREQESANANVGYDAAGRADRPGRDPRDVNAGYGTPDGRLRDGVGDYDTTVDQRGVAPVSENPPARKPVPAVDNAELARRSRLAP